MSGDLDRVLKVFAVYESKEGDVLLANHFVSVANRQDWNIQDLQRGIEEAFAQRFTEKAALGWRLTRRGAEEVAALGMSLPHNGR